ncbi:hypothetical protein WJX74_001206 [Apatococcus lobatus]|uniref:Cleavage and polyadenylation specificity factor subunit 1 n=1 Tax=Apatococcus lobatus TaxID=904363 RepID=A0AAW1QXL9_9CHLO
MATAFYRELHPACGAIQCCSAHFTQPAPKLSQGAVSDLIVVRSNLLEIWVTKFASDTDGKRRTVRLEMLAHYRMDGHFMGMTVVKAKLAQLQCDGILLTFRHARAVVLHWSAEEHTIKPTSLHSWEKENAIKAGRTSFPVAASPCSDLQGRCIVVPVFEHHAAVIPVLDLESRFQRDRGRRPSLPVAVGKSFLLNLNRQKEGRTVHQIRSAAFLHKYTAPTLMVLSEAEPTWAGRLREKKDTVQVSAMSISTSEQKFSEIWEASELPSDAFRVLAVASGGALILCRHLIIFQAQGCRRTTVVNSQAYPGERPHQLDEFTPASEAVKHARKHSRNVHQDAAPEVASGAMRAHGLELELDGVATCWLNAQSLMLALKDGQLWQANFIVTNSIVEELKFERIQLEAPVASGICSLGLGLHFLASTSGDSLLVHASATDQAGQKRKEPAASADAATATDGNQKGAKRMRLDAEGFQAVPGTPAESEDDDLEMSLLYSSMPAAATTLVAEASSDLKYKLKRIDALTQTAPLQSLVAGTPPEPLESSMGPGPPLLVAATGHSSGHQGAITILQRSLVPSVVLAVPFTGMKGVWAVYDEGPEDMPTVPLLTSAPPEGHAPAEATPADPGNSTMDIEESLAPSVVQHDSGRPLETALDSSREHKQQVKGDRNRKKRKLFHAYMFLSSSSGDAGLQGETKVMQLGEQLKEMKGSEIDIDHGVRTIQAGNLCGNSTVVQVHPQGIRLLVGKRVQQEIIMDDLVMPDSDPAAVHIKHACIQDPYLLVHLSDSTVGLFQASSPGEVEAADANESLVESLTGDSGTHIAAASLHQDSSGWLQQQLPPDVRAPISKDGSPGMYLVLCRISGTLQILRLPDARVVFSCSTITEGHRLLHSDSAALPAPPHTSALTTAGPSSEPAPAFTSATISGGEESSQDANQQKDLIHFAGAQTGSSQEAASEPLHVAEVLLESFGPGQAENLMPACERPMLCLLLGDQSLLCYQFLAPPHGSTCTSLRLLRQTHGLLGFFGPQKDQGGFSTCLHRFDNLGEGTAAVSGIFAAGERPLWLVASRGRLIPHPMDPHHHVASFHPFHNPNCLSGFLMPTVSTSGGSSTEALLICELPPKTRLDTPWILRRLRMNGTPHRIAHDAVNNIYAVLSTKGGAYQPRAPMSATAPASHFQEIPFQPDAHASYSYALADAAAKDRNADSIPQVTLLAPDRPGGSLELTPHAQPWKHALHPDEVAVCVSHVPFQLPSGPQHVFAVGTALTLGEDHPCTGRLLLIQAELQQQAGRRSAVGKVVHAQDFYKPVTAIIPIAGHIMLAMGNRLAFFRWNGTDLTPTGRLETSFLVTSAVVLPARVRPLVLYGDIAKGMGLARYSQDGKTDPLAQEDGDSEVTAAGLVKLGGTGLMASADMHGTLRLLEYKPPTPPKLGTVPFLSAGALHVGQRAVGMLQQPMRMAGTRQQQAAVVGFASGAIGCLAPVADRNMDSLLKLQKPLALACPSPMGLNSHAFGQLWKRADAASPLWGIAQQRSCILDCNLLFRYAYLSRPQQAELAKHAGLAPNNIQQLLRDMAALTALF